MDIQKVGCERAQGSVAGSATTNPTILWKTKDSLTTWNSPTKNDTETAGLNLFDIWRTEQWHTRHTAMGWITVIMAYIMNLNVIFVLTVYKKSMISLFWITATRRGVP
jgi:hypothetical protein